MSVSFFTACIAFLLYLDDVTNAYCEKCEPVIQDQYFGERMENFFSSFFLVLCTHAHTHTQKNSGFKEGSKVYKSCIKTQKSCLNLIFSLFSNLIFFEGQRFFNNLWPLWALRAELDLRLTKYITSAQFQFLVEYSYCNVNILRDHTQLVVKYQHCQGVQYEVPGWDPLRFNACKSYYSLKDSWCKKIKEYLVFQICQIMLLSDQRSTSKPPRLG